MMENKERINDNDANSKSDCSKTVSKENGHVLGGDSCNTCGWCRRRSIDQGYCNKTDAIADESDTGDDNEGLPIDRGWAWVILLASATLYLIAIGQMKCFGIVFVQLQERFHSTSSETSLIFTLQNAAYSITALFVMTVGSSMTSRTSIIIGTLLSAVSYLITAFLTDIGIAYLCLGIFVGIGNAFIHPQIATIISVYFDKKRGFANNISNAGVSIGGLVLAPVLTELFKTYAFTGTYMYIAGFHLNMCVLACLYRPMSFYKKRIISERKAAPEEEVILLKDKSCVNQEYCECNESATGQELFGNEVKNLIQRALSNPGQGNEDLTSTRRRRTVSENRPESSTANKTSTIDSLFNSKMARFASTDIINSSLYDLTLGRDIPNTDTSERISSKDKRKMYMTTIRSSIVRLGSRLFDVKLLSKPEFLYYLICTVFLCAGSSLATAYLPPHAYEMGVDNSRIAWIVSSMSIMDFVSRFVFGYISDKEWCHRSTLIAISVITIGVAAQFMHFMNTFGTIMIYAAIAGWLQGVYFALFVVVILDILSVEDFKGALGFTSLIQGTASGLALPCAGYLRDYSGYYYLTFNFVGACLILGGILVYFVPNVHEWSKRRVAKNEESKDDVTVMSP